MKLNKIDLKKILLDFSAISSRLINVNHRDYNSVLYKFLNFIDNQPIIFDFIIDCGKPSLDVDFEMEKASKDWRYNFDLGDTLEQEVSNIYSILKYCLDNKVSIVNQIARGYSSSSKLQDWAKAFNIRVVYVLIRHISNYLEKIGIDMGMDENIKYEIKVTNGQVNLASDNSTINAVMNNGIDFDKLNKLIEAAISKIPNTFDNKDIVEIKDDLDIIKTELSNSNPKKGFIRTALKGLKSFIGQSAELTSAIMAILGFVESIPGIGN